MLWERAANLFRRNPLAEKGRPFPFGESFFSSCGMPLCFLERSGRIPAVTLVLPAVGSSKRESFRHLCFDKIRLPVAL
jgi:hypothetical protein